MASFKSFFSNLSPAQKKTLVVAGAAGALMLVLGAYVASSSGGTARESGPASRKVEYSVLTGKDPKSVGIEALSARQQRSDAVIADLRKQLNDLNSKLGDGKRDSKKFIPFQSYLGQDGGDEGSGLGSAAPEMPGVAPGGIPGEAPVNAAQLPPTLPAHSLSDTSRGSGDPAKFQINTPRGQSPLPQPVMPVAQEIAAPQTAQVGDEPQFKIQVFESKPTERQAQQKVAMQQKVAAKAEASQPKIYIPAGSMFSGTLVTGFDAPTSNQAKKDPHPVLLRVKQEAILPNYYTMDIRECFLLASGYADLSSERALLRSETLSCIRNDGTVLETQLEAYASGEDGKVGLRGHLVSKTGSMIARALLAGFISGLGDAFKPAAVPRLNVSSGEDGSVAYQSPDFGMAMNQGVVTGAQNAAKDIATYYIDMAKNMFPVVEIDAGRKVDFILTRGTSLRAKGDSQQAATAAPVAQQQGSVPAQSQQPRSGMTPFANKAGDAVAKGVTAVQNNIQNF